MKKSKIYSERYELTFADIVKILALDSNQKIIDIAVGGSRGNASPWSLCFTVETTDSTSIEVPTFIEK